jgi:hypothetical protein
LLSRAQHEIRSVDNCQSLQENLTMLEYQIDDEIQHREVQGVDGYKKTEAD